MTDDSQRFGSLTVSTVVTSPPWYENCYLVQDDSSGALLVVDPGGDADSIARAIDASGGTPTEILLTHGHPDHVGAARTLQRRFAIGCRAHAEERALLHQAPAFADALGFPGFEGPENCTFFDGEPELALGDIRFRVRHTPGHSPGGVCYLFDGFCLTGDTLFNHGVGRTDLPGGSGPTLARSITGLLDALDDACILFSGHGPAWKAGEARRWWQQMAGAL